MDITDILNKLIEIQTTDSGLDDLERLKKGFQKDIDLLDTNVASLKVLLQNEKKLLEDILRRRKDLEIETGALESKIQKYLGQQIEVKSNDQYAALKQEIEKGKEDKLKIEEKTLECLFKEDEQKAKIQNLNLELVQAEKKAASEKKEILQKIEDCDHSVKDKKEDYKKQLIELPEEFSQGYEKLRNSGKKIAVARVQEDQTCSGCHMNISPQVLNEIRKNIGIQRCNCGRYLFDGDSL